MYSSGIRHTVETTLKMNNKSNIVAIKIGDYSGIRKCPRATESQIKRTWDPCQIRRTVLSSSFRCLDGTLSQHQPLGTHATCWPCETTYGHSGAFLNVSKAVIGPIWQNFLSNGAEFNTTCHGYRQFLIIHQGRKKESITAKY